MLERINFQPIDPKEVYAYDMHYHTSASFDCQTPLAAILKKAAKHHLNIAITDHNEIKANLKAQQNSVGVKILPGIEVTFRHHRDLLFYFHDSSSLEEFYTKEILPIKRRNLNTMKTSVFSFLEHFEPEKYNAFVVAPHPFSLASKNLAVLFQRHPEKHYLLKKIHAFEIFNSTLAPKRNALAIAWAMKERKPITGGSDGHLLQQLGYVVSYTWHEEDILESIRKQKNFVGGIYTDYKTKTSYLESYMKGFLHMHTARYKQQVKTVERKLESLRFTVENEIKDTVTATIDGRLIDHLEEKVKQQVKQVKKRLRKKIHTK